MIDSSLIPKNAAQRAGFGVKLRLSRKRLRRLYDEADRARDARNWLTASRLYQQILEIDPLNAAIHVQLGHTCKEQGDLTNAERSYRTALQLAPADDDIHLQIGHLEKLKGRFDEAALAYRMAAELNPLNADAVREYAALAPHSDPPPPPLALPLARSEALGGHADPVRPNGSPPDATLSIPDMPNRSAVAQELRSRGDQARDNQRWDEAAEAYQAYLAVVPQDVAILVKLGHTLKESGDLAVAEAAYRAALICDPDNPEIHLWLGHTLKESGDLAAAEAAYRAALTCDPDDPEIHLQLGYVLRLRGETAKAIKAYKAAYRIALTHGPNNSEIHLRLGSALKESGDLATAEAAYRTALTCDPDNSEIHLWLGHTLKESGDLAAAEAAYRAALICDPDDPEIRLWLGHTLKESGDLAAAEAAYRAALTCDPDDPEIHLQLGYVLRLRGETAKAIKAYKAAYRIALTHGPNNSEIHLRLGSALKESGDLATAEAAYRTALTCDPDNSEIHLWLGHTLKESGDLAAAEAAYRAALICDPDDPEIRLWLGHTLKESGDLAAAEAAYRAALTCDPDDPEIHLQLGYVLRLRGETAKAIKAYRRSFELLPLRTTWSELVASDRTSDPLVLPPPGRQRAPAIMLDISDLLIALCTWDFISGIQRVQLGLLSSLLADADAADCQFVAWRHKALWVLSNRRLGSLVPTGSATAPSWQERKQLIGEIEAASVLYSPVAGDVLVSTGVIYFEPDLVAERERLKRAGVRLGAYFHDFIPLTHPEFCDGDLIRNFSSTASEALVHLDFVLTVSQHVADETKRLLKQAEYPEIPIRPVPLAHIFGGEALADDRWTPKIEALRGRDYVLCVGTLSVHKNQSFLVQVWQLLVQEGCNPPLLVLAGAQSFGSDEVRIRLAWSDNVGGRVRIIEKPSDEELAVLYRNCLFTVFPSLVEGWGLPIGESLVHGKLCVASRLASMPEVGGEFAVYIDPYNIRSCTDLLRELFEDRTRLTVLEHRIRSHFKPRTWQEHSRDFLRAVRQTAVSLPDNRDWSVGTLSAGQAIALRTRPRMAEDARSLPPYAALTQTLRGRVMLVRGWHPGESWGTWMAGRRARLSFHTELPPGSAAKVALQFVAAPWTLENTLTIRSACGSTVQLAVPDGPLNENGWPGEGYREMVGAIDCTVAGDRSIDLVLELGGPLRHPWWGEERAIWVGLSRLCCIPREAVRTYGHCSHRWIRPTGLTDPAGRAVYPIGLQSMLAALRTTELLASGWAAPEAWGVWMSGGKARLRLISQLPEDEPVRVLLQLRSGAVGTAVTIAAGVASRTWRLPALAAAHPVWLDCRVGPEGGVLLDISDAGISGAMSARVMSDGVMSDGAARGRRIGLVGIAYGRSEPIEERLALAEAVLYPVAEEPDPADNALLDDIRFTVAGHFKGTYSLAAINRSLSLGLEAAYPGKVRIEQIETDPVDDLSDIPDAERDSLSTFAARVFDATGGEVVIVQHWPVRQPPSCDLPVALFAWEESLVPLDLVAHFNRHYRGMLAQTRAVQKALLDSGIAIPVHRVGCAIDLSRFARIGDSRAATPRPPLDRDHPFVFLHVSSCFPRKGVDVLLTAYGEAFRDDDPVRLVIKTFPNPHNDVSEQIARLRMDDPNFPAIELINQDLADEQLAELYAQADAMVLPTRGEGFNMPAAEAMAAGIPLIVTGHGGHLDFVGSEIARLVDYRFAPSRSHVAASGSVWIEPDRNDLVAALREMVAQARRDAPSAYRSDKRIEPARQAVAPLGDRREWGRRVAAAVCRLTVTPLDRVSIGWVSSWRIRCGIAEYSRHLLRHFDDADKKIRIFCDERTRSEALTPGPGNRGDGGDRVPAQIAWRQADGASMDGLAAAIDQSAVETVVVQHHNGYMYWDHLAGFLRDPRVQSRPVLVFLHHPRDLFNIDDIYRDGIVAALRLASRLLVHSVSDLNILKGFGLVNNVTLFPHGADRSSLAPPPVRNFAGGGAPLLGAYGFFFPHKGFDKLIQALPALRERWPETRLRFVTAEHEDGASRHEIARCRALAGTLGVAGAIEWYTNYLPDDRSLALLNECDLVVLPYRDTTESASGAARIALASRAPVAVTPIRIFEELDGAVLRLPGGKTDDLADGIAALLDDAGGRRQAIEAAGKWLDDHDWQITAARLKGMVTGIVATERTGGGTVGLADDRFAD
ncbi:MAG: tetratricopeptide repeat protein [Alphaproteobacteria bacterium]